jgi:hypothetical protein
MRQVLIRWAADRVAYQRYTRVAVYLLEDEMASETVCDHLR